MWVQLHEHERKGTLETKHVGSQCFHLYHGAPIAHHKNQNRNINDIEGIRQDSLISFSMLIILPGGVAREMTIAMSM